jgi:hypothetical protein
MKTMRLLALATLLAIAAPATLPAEESEVPDIPKTPAAVDELVYARPFTLEKGYKFEWRKEQPLVKEGYILVLKVNPDLVYPRQAAEPVLFVGDQTAERVNIGYKSGHVVAIVPGKLDLKKALMWFGTPQLPERCTAKTIAEERKLAEQASIKPLAAAMIASAQKKGGERLEVADRYELRRAIAGLIKEYAPDESELVDALLVPRND